MRAIQRPLLLVCTAAAVLVPATESRAAFVDDYPFDPAVNAGAVLNTSSNDYQPSVTADGNTLVFSSDRPGGNGSWDLWMATRTGGVWATPQNLGATVNGSALDTSPAIMPDGSAIFFRSARDLTCDSCIWRTDWDGSAWTAPVLLPSGVNAGRHNIPLDISPDGRWLYYARGNTSFQTHRVDLTSYDSGSGQYLVIEGPVGPGGSQTILMCHTPDERYGLFRAVSGSPVSSEIIGGVYQPGVPLGPPFTIGTSYTSYCSMPADGNSVWLTFFNVAGGLGGWDLWFATKACSVAADCDDGFACTLDECISGACVNTPDDSVCDNGTFCDGVEVCDPALGCQPAPRVRCDDQISCTVDSCQEGPRRCNNTPDDALCDDGLVCNGSETCDAVLDCQPGTLIDCSDGVGCTDDVCLEPTGACSSSTNDANCDDGLFCNGVETCDATADCQPATAVPSCDDGVGCTDDACNLATDSCESTLNDTLCDNGLFCDGPELCHATLDCLPGTGDPCPDGVSCTVDSCDEASDSCINTPDDSVCQNGLFCDGAEVCDPTTDCQAGATVACDDGVACTVDSCDEATGSCTSTPDDTLCDDGNFCNGVETCSATLGCQPATAVPTCDDGVACTMDSCSTTLNACENLPDNGFCDNGLFCDGVEVCDTTLDCQPGATVGCDDGVACTIDGCDESTDSCTNTPDATACDNGLFCDGVEVCDPTLDCQPGASVACDDGVACTVDACDEATDSCNSAPNDALCDDGRFCNGAETCDAVLGCQGNTSASCDDGIPCTIDVCSDVTGGCDHLPDDSVCDNGLYCDGVEVCDVALGCQPGTAVVCDDGMGCTADSCDESTDSCSATPDDSLCDNGIFCDGDEWCDPVLGCRLAAGPNCDDGILCTIDSCDESTRSCSNAPNDGRCSNGLFCDGVEVCDATLGCLPGTEIDCSDGIDCTVDTCDEDANTCENRPNNVACDNALYCDGVELCDVAAGCLPGSPVACGGGTTCDEEANTCVRPAATDGGSGTDAGDADAAATGCGCAPGGESGGAAWLLAAVVGLLTVRRRRR